MLRKLVQLLVNEVINAIAKRLEDEKATPLDQGQCCEGCDVVSVKFDGETGSVKICEGSPADLSGTTS